MQKFFVALGAAAIIAGAQPAVAQTYPSKPVRVVVPFPPGGVDVTLRLMQPMMSQDLGQPLVIENRAGANGYIGTENVVRSEPDGYTLLATSIAVVAAPAVVPAPFDPVKDLTPITQMQGTYGVIVVRPSLKVTSVRELIEYAKNNPGKLSYGTSGIGSAQHIDIEYFKLLTNTEMTHIAYKGGGPLVQAVVRQEVDVAFFPLQQIRQHIDSGKTRMIAMWDERRHPQMTHVESVAESVPKFTRTSGWTGMFGPAGLPQAVVRRINAAAVKALLSPEIKAKIEATSIVAATTPEEFARVVRDESERIRGKVAELRARGIRFE